MIMFDDLMYQNMDRIFIEGYTELSEHANRVAMQRDIRHARITQILEEQKIPDFKQMGGNHFTSIESSNMSSKSKNNFLFQ